MHCKHCRREMECIVQPPLLPTRRPLELFTCQTPHCKLFGQTLSADHHGSLTSAEIDAYGRTSQGLHQRREASHA